MTKVSSPPQRRSLLGRQSKAWNAGRFWIIAAEDDFILVFPSSLFISSGLERDELSALLGRAGFVESEGEARMAAEEELRDILLATYRDLTRKAPQ